MQRTLRSRSPLVELIVLGIVVVLVISVFMYWSSNRDAEEQSAGDLATANLLDDVELGGDWPPMTLVYEVDGTVTRLDYRDETYWRKEVIESTSNPDVVGLVAVFDGTTYKEYDPRLIDADGNATVTTDEITDGIVVPERWIRPGLAGDLIAKGYTIEMTEHPGEIALTQTGSVGCPPLPPVPAGEQPPRLPSHLEVCYTTDRYQETERYVLRTDISPPVSIAMTIVVEGEMTVSAEVRDIDLSPPDGNLTLPPSRTATPATP